MNRFKYISGWKKPYKYWLKSGDVVMNWDMGKGWFQYHHIIDIEGNVVLCCHFQVDTNKNDPMTWYRENGLNKFLSRRMNKDYFDQSKFVGKI